LLGDLTVEKLLSFNYNSQIRNKLIAKAFKEIGAIEKYDSGIKRILIICEQYGVITPKFNASQNGFKVILYKEKLNGGVNEGVNGGINEGINALYNYIKENPGLRITQFENILNVPPKTLERWIKLLKGKNKLVYKGSKKTGGYFAI
jgi:ATP-dependent DNA helicase RecG